jgi:hypothetical protein
MRHKPEAFPVIIELANDRTSVVDPDGVRLQPDVRLALVVGPVLQPSPRVLDRRVRKIIHRYFNLFEPGRLVRIGHVSHPSKLRYFNRDLAANAATFHRCQRARGFCQRIFSHLWHPEASRVDAVADIIQGRDEP